MQAESKETTTVDGARLFLQLFLGFVSGTMLFFAFAAGRLGISEAGLWSRHSFFRLLLGLTAFALLQGAFALRRARHEFWLVEHAQPLAIACMWVLTFAAGLGALELYARHVRGYALWWLSLRSTNFIELDRMKIYNRRFYEHRQVEFRWWPIPLELFDAGQPTPRYLFKPNLRMARHGNRLSPALPGEDAYWSSNSWGFRGPEFPLEKPPGMIRIICLGASTTEGSQGDRETYPYFLQQQLVQAFPGRAIEVINAGHHGQTIEDLLEILKERVLPLQPDILIFYEARNNLLPGEFVAGTDSAGLHLRVEHWLYENSALFQLIADRLGWMLYLPHNFDLTQPKPNLARYKQTLSEIVRETIGHGSVIVLSSFVTLAHAGLRVSYMQNPLLFRSLYREYEPLTPEEIAQMYVYVNQQSVEVAREFCVPYVDVASQFPRDPRYFPFDLIHLTPEGNRMLAAMFVSLLEKEVLPQMPAWKARQYHTLGIYRPGEIQANFESSSSQCVF